LEGALHSPSVEVLRLPHTGDAPLRGRSSHRSASHEDGRVHAVGRAPIHFGALLKRAAAAFR
jgi:hypothetical protein